MIKIDSVYCINLKSRPDRWERFLENLPSDWNLPRVDRFCAVDGDKIPLPTWWGGTPGMYGCFQSHMRCWENAIVSGYENVLVLEDDVSFSSNFASQLAKLLDGIPEDWDQIYLGGDCYIYDEPKISEFLIKTKGVATTHCYVVRRRFMKFLYKLLISFKGDNSVWNIDKQLMRVHAVEGFNIYRSARWLAFQCDRLDSDTRSDRKKSSPSTVCLAPGRYVITSDGVIKK